MEYDNRDLNNDAHRDFMGEFEMLYYNEEVEDAWHEEWIGRNTKTGTICQITGYEVSGYYNAHGGTGFRVEEINIDSMIAEHSKWLEMLQGWK